MPSFDDLVMLLTDARQYIRGCGWWEDHPADCEECAEAKAFKKRVTDVLVAIEKEKNSPKWQSDGYNGDVLYTDDVFITVEWGICGSTWEIYPTGNYPRSKEFGRGHPILKGHSTGSNAQQDSLDALAQYLLQKDKGCPDCGYPVGMLEYCQGSGHKGDI